MSSLPSEPSTEENEGINLCPATLNMIYSHLDENNGGIHSGEINPRDSWDDIIMLLSLESGGDQLNTSTIENEGQQVVDNSHPIVGIDGEDIIYDSFYDDSIYEGYGWVIDTEGDPSLLEKEESETIKEIKGDLKDLMEIYFDLSEYIPSGKYVSLMDKLKGMYDKL